MKNIFLTMSLGIGLLFPCKLHAQSQYPFQNTTLSTEERVDDLIKRMTLEEKIDLLSGYNDFYLHPCERLGIPAFKLADGPLGVASWGLFGRATAPHFHQHFRWLPLGIKIWQRKQEQCMLRNGVQEVFIFS